ncbi:MAG: secondary thiamine-phosphate synthase enzyme YjbQ [Gammaproteobacteria bacterium]|nr:secondary thiamine-phosphate synthase enzyme YjbQ [Gammaproteobacteria bacterium]
MIIQQSFKIQTPGRGMIEVTKEVAEIVKQSEISIGICNVFLHHTSASIVICENDDITVQHDLERFFGHLISDGHMLFEHVAEGPDDMSAHVRSIMTQSSLSIPITQKKLDLGRWQGIYLWEHRLKAHDRKITVTLQGE